MATVPDTNVNLATNIRDVLNAAGGSVSNDVITFFSAAAKTNKWARYKPESYAKNFDLTEDERKANRYGLALSSAGSLFGSGVKPTSGNIDISEDYNGFLYKLCKGTLGQFEYIRPSGGSSNPYRLGDFRGYDTDAVNPLPIPTAGTYKYTSAGAVDIPMTVNTPSVNGLTMDLLSTDGNVILQNMYFGIILYNSDLTDVIFGTQTADQKDKGRNVLTLVNSDYADITSKRGTYNAKTFFSNVPIALNDYTANASILVGDDDVAYKVSIVPDYLEEVTLSKEYKTISSTRHRLVVNVTNNTDAAITVTSCKFRQSGNAYDENANNVPLTIAAWQTRQVYYETSILSGDSFTATLVINGTTYTV